MIALCALLLGSALPPALPPSPLPGPTTTATPPLATPVATPPGATPVATAPGATPAPAASPSGALTPLPSPVAPTPSPAGTAAPSVAPATPSPYHYRFVPHQPANPAPGTPQIYAVYLNEHKLRSLGPIEIRVETNADVVKVVSRSNGRDGVVPFVSPGVFAASGRLPKIPFIAEGMSIDIQFIATTADGRKTTVGVPVQLN